MTAALTKTSTPLLQRLLHGSFGRDLLMMVLLCSAIAALLTVLFGGWASKLVYSFAIGMSIWAVNATLYSVVDRLRVMLPGSSAPPAPLGLPPQALLVALGMVTGGSVGIALGDAAFGHDSPALWDWHLPGARVTLTITVLATLVATVLMGLQARMARVKAQADAARRDAAEMQLRLLQSQLEPHMLFNTLANLRVLIGLDPARAQAMLDRLIGFLRATLAASRADRHTLRDEFARVDDYLALMALRMGGRLRTHLDLPDDLAALTVPPLLLQPLVENAIRHGLEPQVGGGHIDVSARRRGQRLVLLVHDTGVGLDAASADHGGSRFGLQQVRQRLSTLHGAAASFSLSPAPGGGALARIELPLSS